MRNRILLFITLLAAVPACVVVSTPPGTQPETSSSVAPATSSASPESTPPPAASTTPPAASTPPPAASTPPPVASTTPPASSGSSPGQAPGDVALFGTWKSASCGSRKYERLITLTKDKTFTAEDRVSPCPPKVKCIWAGIVNRKGSYKRDGNTLLLSADGDPKGPGAQPFPTSLSIDAATGAPVEANSGGKACVYQH